MTIQSASDAGPSAGASVVRWTIGAGLLTRTFANLQKVEMGYDGDVVHATRIMLLADKYPDDQARITFTDRALEQHISDNALGDDFSEEMIANVPVGHLDLINASVVLPLVEEIVRSDS